jgi:hypothetical protein
MGGAKAIPIMLWTTAMGFAKGSTHPTICPTGWLICPTGKSAKIVSSPLCKNISVFPKYKSSYMCAVLSHREGRLEIVTDAGQDAVDASGVIDEGAFLRTEKACGPDAPTLASSS